MYINLGTYHNGVEYRRYFLPGKKMTYIILGTVRLYTYTKFNFKVQEFSLSYIDFPGRPLRNEMIGSLSHDQHVILNCKPTRYLWYKAVVQLERKLSNQIFNNRP